MITRPMMAGILARPPGGGAFSLGSYSGLVAWYDASQLAYSDGDAIDNASKKWTDLSGNSRDLGQSSVGNRPVFKTAQINGLNVVRFLGSSSQYLTVSDSGFPTGDFTIVHVVKPTLDYANGVYAWLGGWGTAASTKMVLALIAGNSSWGGNSLYGVTQNGDAAPDFTSWSANTKSCYNAVNVLLMTRTGNTWNFWKSTTSTHLTRTGMSTAPQLGGTFYAGHLPGVGGNAITADLGEHAVWNRVLSGAEISAIMTGLGAKWGVTINT